MSTDPTKYKFNHSMLRIKDPKESVKFYEFLGMKQVKKLENPDAKFDLYFLAYDSPKAVSHNAHWSDREGIIELTHNYGTENDPNYKIANGNSEPGKGFGHVCVSVDNIQAACSRLEDAGYKFQKKLTDGRMRSIAFALDPDGYWVEIIAQNPVDKTEGVKETDVQTYRMNHTMIRVKDAEKSLAFYKDVMGMNLKRVSENKDANFNLYFLGYGPPAPDHSANGVNPVADREGLLELTWNYGTEKDEGFKYHDGNAEPQGFGHICVSVDDLDAACARFEEKKVSWKKRLTDGRMKNIAFVLDPDGYWIEVIQNEKLKQRANCSETKVTAALLAAGKRLKVVARAGVGVDNVDVQAATKHGIIVVNSPVGNINAAAEHTVALLMAVARNIGDACASLKAGKWERSRLVGVEVKGKTLAIVGLGKVGLTVARIANGLGMDIIAYDPYANPSLAAAASVELLPSLSELLTDADFLTLHTPLIASTKGMISAPELATMKCTARILNVARGGMIDETALLEALDAGTIAGAGIDVFTSEPPKPDDTASRLIAHPKVVATPHLGASTVEAQENVSIDVCTQVLSILSGQLPRSAVNAPIILPEEYRTLQPFVALVEKMGSLYTQHYKSKTFRTTFDLVYEGSLAALNTTKPLFAALVKGVLTPISDDLNINIVNAELIAKERGILINESRSRENVEFEGYSSSVTLRARVSPRSPSTSRQNKDPFNNKPVQQDDQIITGNYDSPGKIGVVGQQLGKVGVNIRSMSVASLDKEDADLDKNGSKEATANGGVEGQNEALMILGVEGTVEEHVTKSLVGDEGVLEASVVVL